MALIHFLLEINMKASDFVFCVDLVNDPDSHAFCITSAEYFEENGCICDGQEDDDIENLLPPRFGNLAEGQWEYYGGTWEQGKQKLLDAGFVYNDELHKFINHYDPNDGFDLPPEEMGDK